MTTERKPLGLAAAALVVIVGGWWWYSWLTSPERLIDKQLGRIQEHVSKAPGEDSLGALAKARSVSELFADNFEFVAEQFDFHTRDRRQLISGIQQYRSQAQSILMHYPGKDLSVDPDESRATSLVTVQFFTQARDLSGREAYRFQINWLEQDGEWRMDYVRLLEIMEEPPRSWIP